MCLLAESAWPLGLLAWLAKQVGGCFISVFTSPHTGLFAGKYHPDRDAADLGEIVLQTWGEDMAAEKLVLAVFGHGFAWCGRTRSRVLQISWQ